jgi:hypothetical protein
VPYYWFHAFKRDSVEETIAVLRAGPAIHPSPLCRTRQNETALAISPPCVYAYLGRTHEAFGDTAISLPIAALNGRVSPFDSGGLVEHTRPVSEWEAETRRNYLAQFTWTTGELGALLPAYPTDNPARRRAYLNADRPPHDGPHAIWPPEDARLVASIWSEPNEWRSWFWEGRSEGHLPITDNLVAWSCTNTAYGLIRALTENLPAPADVAWAEGLMSKYISGGVSVLIEKLRLAQEAA